MRPSTASHSGPENKEERRPGTLRSTSRPSQCRPLPRPRTSTARRSLGLAPLRPESSFTGNVIVVPFVSSIRSARSCERYAAKTARGSAFAARRPAREVRAKFARSSFYIQPGIRSDLRMQTERLGYEAARIVPNSVTVPLSQNCPRRLLRRPSNIPHSVQTRTPPYQPPTRGRHPFRTPDRGTPDDPIPGLRAFSPAMQTRSFQIANQDS
jgi:hypothetical protein